MLKKRVQGQTLLETAICLPLLLTVGLAVFQFTLLTEARIIASYAAHNASRSLTVNANLQTAASQLELAHRAAATTLAAITPLPSRFLGLLGRFNKNLLVKNAMQQSQLSIEKKIEAANGKELLLELQYNYPLVVPLANRLFVKLFAPKKERQRYGKFPYQLAIRAKSLTSFQVSR